MERGGHDWTLNQHHDEAHNLMALQLAAVERAVAGAE